MKEPERITVGSGNVFADLGVANPEQALLKSQLAAELSGILAAMGLLNDQARVADILGIDQPKVSKLLRGRLKDFSEQRLMKFLTLLGSTVEIVVHPPKQPRSRKIRRGRVQVVHANR
jgi:predicted XRE-type DNA-binding protein